MHSGARYLPPPAALPAALLLAVAACTPATPPATPAAAPSITATRPVETMAWRSFTFPELGVWLSNEVEGGRVNDAWQENDSTITVLIRPENAPINNSAWYAFKVWSRAPRDIHVRLTYEDGRHRYWPETLRAGGAWTRLDSSAVRLDDAPRAAVLRLRVTPDTMWVAGQTMKTSSWFRAWTDSLSARRDITRTVIGTTPGGRPIHMLQFGDTAARRHVMLISRQHPPEVTGTMAFVRFIEELAGESALATEFRSHFRVHAVPLVNPDGVDLGHWRHNTGGVDLNRDWVEFNQPETRAVRDAFLRIMAQPGATLWFGADFHSTQRDVFYTLDRSLETMPPGLVDRWLAHISATLPHYRLEDSPSGLATPTSRNWFYSTFGAPALIYEVGDETDRALIREVATTAARGTMTVLLEELARGGR
jgi:cytosolic carboxypeptidase protein 6